MFSLKLKPVCYAGLLATLVTGAGVYYFKNTAVYKMTAATDNKDNDSSAPVDNCIAGCTCGISTCKCGTGEPCEGGCVSKSDSKKSCCDDCSCGC